MCGVMALFLVLSAHRPAEGVMAALIPILASTLFDFLDGFSARLLKCYSPLGVQLDSLADMVSFGVVPSVVLLRLFQMCGGISFWGYALLLLAAFSALRLAKFNIDPQQSHEFSGLPTPACALLVVAFGYHAAANGITIAPYWFFPIAAILCVLLIAPVGMFSLKFQNFRFSDNAVRYIFLACAAAMVGVFGVQGIGLAIILYILTSLVMALFTRLNRARE